MGKRDLNIWMKQLIEVVYVLMPRRAIQLAHVPNGNIGKLIVSTVNVQFITYQVTAITAH